MQVRLLIAVMLAAIALAGCGGGGGGDAQAPIATTPTPTPTPTPPPVTPPPKPDTVVIGFEKLSAAAWDELAVRKVLHTFAYGGHASDAQISLWAGMDPDDAIRQMLTFEQHNLLLSPPSPDDLDGLSGRSGLLRDLASFWASDHPNNRVPEELRDAFILTNSTGWLDILWAQASTMRGLNPFLHRIGLWETNYHLATNLDSSVQQEAMVTYYDTIVTALGDRLPYDDVLAIAASSAAVAIQYGHRFNRFRHNKCECNEDFAREFYQLFFGILGDGDPEYHETVTIKNTALALTDMKVAIDEDLGLADEVTFGTAEHYPGQLEMLHGTVGGTNARERIDQLADLAIEHAESLANLPVMIISGLADDNLDDAKISQVRAAWASMGEKDLLAFLRAYATSTAFHDESRVKYLSSFDRNLLIINKVSISNEESYIRVIPPTLYISEGVHVFRPLENVFGGQTGMQAAQSSSIFRTNFNRTTGDSWFYRRADGTLYGRTFSKDWRKVIPRDSNQEYGVRHTAYWLWNHLIADGHKNLGPLERAHLYALLGTSSDLAELIDENDLDRVYTEADVSGDPQVAGLMAQIAQQNIALDDPDPAVRLRANQGIGQAINFILGTPFIFLHEGR